MAAIAQNSVLQGIRNPQEGGNGRKEARRGVILGVTSDGWAMVAPVTSYPEREGRVPVGGVLLTSSTSIWRRAGFTVEQVAIMIRDLFVVRVDSFWLENAEVIGTLTPKNRSTDRRLSPAEEREAREDRRFQEQLRDCLRNYPPARATVIE
jgi:hypothetical protein